MTLERLRADTREPHRRIDGAVGSEAVRCAPATFQTFESLLLAGPQSSADA